MPLGGATCSPSRQNSPSVPSPYSLVILHQGRGSRGEGKGGNCPPPPNFLSQGDGYACPPPYILAITRHINIFAPPPKKKSFPSPCAAWLLGGAGLYRRWVHIVQRVAGPLTIFLLLIWGSKLGGTTQNGTDTPLYPPPRHTHSSGELNS